MLPKEARTRALPVSVAVVLATWAASLWSHVFRAGADAMATHAAYDLFGIAAAYALYASR